MLTYEHLEATILSTEDLAAAKAFYETVFDAAWVYEDDVSAMFKLGPIVIGLLSRDAMGDLTRPATPGADHAPPRTIMTLRVRSADDTCAELRAKGITILDGPDDRPWGRRTATFADPSGHFWEIAEVFSPAG